MFSIMSKKPYIGQSYVDKNRKKHLKAKMYTTTHNGKTIDLPRTLREKIFKSRVQRDRIKSTKDEQSVKDYWKEYTRLKEIGFKDPNKLIDQSKYITNQNSENKRRK